MSDRGRVPERLEVFPELDGGPIVAKGEQAPRDLEPVEHVGHLVHDQALLAEADLVHGPQRGEGQHLGLRDVVVEDEAVVLLLAP